MHGQGSQSGPPPGSLPEEFIARLESAFFANAARSSTQRRAALAGVISSATAELSPEQAGSLVEEVKQQLAGTGARPSTGISGPTESTVALEAENQELKSRVSELEAELKMRSAAYDHLVDLSNHFLGDQARFEEKEQIQRFCNRIKGSFDILMSAFKDLLKGRKRFQMEYAMYFGMGKSMDGTRVIRTGEDKDVGRKFFEWNTLENVEASSAEMARALDELKYHQLAFLSGYKRSVKEGTLNAIRALFPSRLEQEFIGQQVSVGPFKIPYRFLPFKRIFLYNKLCRAFEELVAEDVQFFEAKFRNAFTSGYVEVMNRKARMQQKEKYQSRGN